MEVPYLPTGLKTTFCRQRNSGGLYDQNVVVRSSLYDQNMDANKSHYITHEKNTSRFWRFDFQTLWGSSIGGRDAEISTYS